MSNQVDKLNGIALTSIETFNAKTDANIEKLNGKTFLGLTAGTWSDSGHDMATGRSRHWGAGATRSSMLIGNGQNTSIQTIEYYNGSANSAVQAGKNPSQAWGVSNAGGTQTDAVKAGGFNSDASNASQDDSEEWNGTSWSNNTTVGYNWEAGQGAGASSTAFSVWGGYNSQSGQSVVNGREYNGSSWSDDTAAPAPFYAGASGADNNNSVFVMGGYYNDNATSASSSFSSANKAWYFNGSGWSNTSEGGGGAGTVWSSFGGGVSFGWTLGSAGTTYLTGDSGATWSTGGSVGSGKNGYFSAACTGGNRCGNSNVDGGFMGGDYVNGEGSNGSSIFNFDR